MVKLTGPGMATGASGSLAGQLTFSKWKGRAYLKTKSRPKQPDSPGQVAMRQVMSFLAGAWRTLAAADQATYDVLARATEISPFNAYQKYNLSRYNNWLFPSQRYPATEDAHRGNLGPWNIHPLPRAISVDIQIPTLGNRWGMAHFIILGAPVTPTKNILIRIYPITDYELHSFIIRDLNPGQYSIMRGPFTKSGTFPNVWQSKTTTVTDA